MSQMVEAVRPTSFVLLPLQALPCQDREFIDEVVRTYERAFAEVRALLRPPITERVFANAWN
jgi:hypothetical protein